MCHLGVIPKSVSKMSTQFPCGMFVYSPHVNRGLGVTGSYHKVNPFHVAPPIVESHTFCKQTSGELERGAGSREFQYTAQ